MGDQMIEDVTGLWIITTENTSPEDPGGRVYRFDLSLQGDSELFSGQLLDFPDIGATVSGKCMQGGKVQWKVADSGLFFQGTVEPGGVTIKGRLAHANNMEKSTRFEGNKKKPRMEKEEAETLAGSKASLLAPGSSEPRRGHLRDLLCVHAAVPQAAAPHAAAVAYCLKDKDPATRCCAVETLKLMGRGAVAHMPKVVLMLGVLASRDESYAVRYCALEALGAMGEAADSEMGSVVGALRDKCRHVRLRALQLLAAPSKAAYAAPPTAYAERAKEALAEYGDAAAAETRLAVLDLPLEDTGPHQKAWIELVDPVLEAGLADEDAGVRCGAVRVLKGFAQVSCKRQWAQLEDTLAVKYVDTLAALLEDTDPLVQTYALDTLQAMGPAAAAKLGFHFVE